MAAGWYGDVRLFGWLNRHTYFMELYAILCTIQSLHKMSDRTRFKYLKVHDDMDVKFVFMDTVVDVFNSKV